MAYVVEVLDLMWEFGYDGHNLEEIARYYMLPSSNSTTVPLCIVTPMHVVLWS